jgi:hypothetical protein
MNSNCGKTEKWPEYRFILKIESKYFLSNEQSSVRETGARNKSKDYFPK